MKDILIYKYCYFCNMIKPPRAHHCRHCNKCVLMMDHHCHVLGTCIGLKNYKPYFLLLFYSQLSLLWIIATTEYKKDPINISLLIISFVAAFQVFYLLMFHVFYAFNNISTIEEQTLEDFNPFFIGDRENISYHTMSKFCWTKYF